MSSNSPYKMYRVKDKTDDFTTDKGILDNIPFRMLLCGKSGCSKTSKLCNLLLLPNFYGNDFHGNDIYIVSPLKNDEKIKLLIKQKDIPMENIYTEYDDEALNEIYDEITEEFEERVSEGKKPYPKLVILDDISFSGGLKQGRYNATNRFFMNSRKHLCSIIATSQKYSQISTEQRSNASSCILFNTSMKELDLIETDCNMMKTRKAFINMFRDNVKERMDYMIVNFSNDNENLYLNKNFEKINREDYDK